MPINKIYLILYFSYVTIKLYKNKGEKYEK